jgi:hypothetical protein
MAEYEEYAVKTCGADFGGYLRKQYEENATTELLI